MEILTFENEQRARIYARDVPTSVHDQDLDFWVWEVEAIDLEGDTDDLTAYSYEAIEWSEIREQDVDFKDAVGERNVTVLFRHGHYVGDYSAWTEAPLVDFGEGGIRVSFGNLPSLSIIETQVDETLARWVLH